MGSPSIEANESLTCKVLEVEEHYQLFPPSHLSPPFSPLHQMRSVLHIIQKEATERTEVGIRRIVC